MVQGRSPADVREIARVVLVDRSNRVLLLRIVDAERRLAWALPGGGVEGDEQDEGTLRRELVEEFGVSAVRIGPLVSRREHVFPVQGRPHLWRERHYLASLERGDITHKYARWWRADELERSRARFSPPELRKLLVRTLVEGPPREPVDLAAPTPSVGFKQQPA